MILFFPSRNAPITRQVKRMLLAIYTRVGGLCPGPPRATAAAAAAAAATAAAAAAQTKRRGAQSAPGVRRVIQHGQGQPFGSVEPRMYGQRLGAIQGR